jgi:hypothetical protein
MGRTIYGDDPTRPLRENFPDRREWMRAYVSWWQKLKRTKPRDLEAEKLAGARGAPVPEGAPPRPKRVDFETSAAYHRAYENWRGKYDPRRKAAIKVRAQANYAKNQDIRRAYKRSEYAERIDELKARQAGWRDANRDKLRALQRDAYATNPEIQKRVKIAVKKYRHAARRASPPWLTADHWAEINAFYETAMLLTLETGEEHHVDHIWPLQGKKSCGLHVPWNLQILTATANLKKRNGEPR